MREYAFFRVFIERDQLVLNVLFAGVVAVCGTWKNEVLVL